MHLTIETTHGIKFVKIVVFYWKVKNRCGSLITGHQPLLSPVHSHPVISVVVFHTNMGEL